MLLNRGSIRREKCSNAGSKQIGKVASATDKTATRSSCIAEEVIIHELLHVIGLWHEHMREDRDQYITVLWDNVQKGKFPKYNKVLMREAKAEQLS
ncbi:unnamed protein product [Strongylus vulgaris]|uniref:Metalloendopeptidase n=1 Tax=Strongylus vulgaris TaxID=40348 RepID=A0A3P7IQ17_STRVU|nr:unnamed protein product [Strongylus vulgaris]